MIPMTNLTDTPKKCLSPIINSSLAAASGLHKRGARISHKCSLSRNDRQAVGGSASSTIVRARRLGDGYLGHLQFVGLFRVMRFPVVREPGVNLRRSLVTRQEVLTRLRRH